MIQRFGIICLIILVGTASVLNAQSKNTAITLNKQLEAKGVFNLAFYDTLGTAQVIVTAVYKSESGYMIGLDTAKPDVSIGKELNYFVFEFEFNKAVQKSLNITKSIRPNSTQEVYRMIWALNQPGSNAEEAGIIQFNNCILVLDDNTPENFDRRSVIDTLISNRLLGTTASLQRLKEDLVSTVKAYSATASYSANILKNETEGVQHSINTMSPSAFSADALVYTDFRNKFDALAAQTRTLSAKYLDIRKAAGKYSIYDIKNVEIQFERGFIEKVKVWVAYRNAEYIFENIYAIGFSSTKNFKSLANVKLLIRNNDFDNHPYILLGDVIRNYDNRLSNYTRDYCPADTSFNIDPNSVSEVKLYRDKYINLLDAKIFTDLKGVNKSNPQGLFQIEVSKRLNINTIRYQIGRTRSDFGYFNYLTLFGGLSKIEENNREITLRNRNLTSNGVLSTPNYAANLDYLLHENYNAGVILNGILFDKHDQKYTLYADIGLKYGHVSVADTVITPTGVMKNPAYVPDLHTATFAVPKITLELFSESRFNVWLAYSLNYTCLFSNNSAKQIMSYKKSDLAATVLDKRARLSNTYEAFVKLTPNKDRASHIFMRLRFHTQYGDMNTSFSQIQIGYSYNWAIAR